MTIRDDVEEIQRIDAEIEQLKEQRAELVDNVVANMEDQRVVVENVGLIEKVPGSSSWTKWKHEETTSAVLRLAADSRIVKADGELESTAEAQLRLYRQAAAPSWRSGALRDMGIDPHEYATFKPAKPSIKIHPVGVIK